MLSVPAAVRIFVCRGATDLRGSFDRLSAMVTQVLRQDPLLCGGPRYVAGRDMWRAIPARGFAQTTHADPPHNVVL